MQITRTGIETQKGSADWFTGDAYIDAIAAPAGTSTLAAPTSTSLPAPGPLGTPTSTDRPSTSPKELDCAA